MKQFFAALALLAVVGFAGFLYRNTLEMRGPHDYVIPGTRPAICTQEAMVCPDGSSVGRNGPGCTFAQCPVVSTTTLQIAATTTATTSSSR